MKRFRDLGYERLPRHVQEGMLLRGPAALKKVKLHGYQIDAKVRRRFNTMMRTAEHFEKTGKSREQFLLYLARAYRGTYYFYSSTTSRPPAGAKTE